MYKLRIYETKGFKKGDLKKEEFFVTKEKMDTRYNQLFVRELYALNPTAWKKTETGQWTRISGY